MDTLAASPMLYGSRWSLTEEPPEIQTDKKEQKVDRAALGAELRRLHGAGPHQRLTSEYCRYRKTLNSSLSKARPIAAMNLTIS